MADVHRLIDILHRLVEGGNSVIDLGQERNHIVAEGTPEEVAECESSYTGQFLKKVL